MNQDTPGKIDNTESAQMHRESGDSRVKGEVLSQASIRQSDIDACSDVFRRLFLICLAGGLMVGATLLILALLFHFMR